MIRLPMIMYLAHHYLHNLLSQRVGARGDRHRRREVTNLALSQIRCRRTQPRPFWSILDMPRGWDMDGAMFGVPLPMLKPWGLHAQLGGARPKVEELKRHKDYEINIKAQWRTPSARAQEMVRRAAQRAGVQAAAVDN
jgi:hypothetical protein